jgi:cytochrome P450
MSESWTVQGITIANLPQAQALTEAAPEQVDEVIVVFNAAEETTMEMAIEEVLGVPVE